MAIQARRGNEADFDASKMLPGEWAVSLDTKYVRMCFAPGVVLRMATYESFETDKAQIQAILKECKTIQSAVQRIQSEVNSKASMVVEYSNSAKESADRAYSEAERAKIYANNAEAIAGVGIATKDKAGLVKADDILIDADGLLRFITTTTETTMPNSNEGRLLFKEISGKTEQATSTGSQLFDSRNTELGSINSTTGAKEDTTAICRTKNPISVNSSTKYVLSYTSGSATLKIRVFEYDSAMNYIGTFIASSGVPFETSQNAKYLHMHMSGTSFPSDTTLNVGTTVLPYEPYTGGIPSPNPSYPQEIKSVKGKNLLDCRGLAKQTVNGVTFNPVYDTNGNLQYVEVNGTATANSDYYIVSSRTWTEESGIYILSGCPTGGVIDQKYALYLGFGGNYPFDVGNGASFQFENGTKYFSFIRIYANYTATDLRFYPMIRKASIPDSTYVPYGLLRVKTMGSNWLDISKVDTGGSESCNIEGNGKKITVTSIHPYSGVRFDVMHLRGKSFYLVGDNVSGNGSYTIDLQYGSTYVPINDGTKITLPMDAPFARVRIISNNTGNTLTTATRVSVENLRIVESKDIPWQPYTESSITLSQPIELYGIGDVVDVIEDGKVKRKYKKVKLKDLSFRQNPLQGDRGAYIYYTQNTSDTPKDAQGLCTHFKVMENSAVRWESLNAGEMLIISNAFVVGINIATLEEFNEYINTNDVEMVYELATPTTEDLPIADQIALNSLKTYDGITYLEFDSEIEPTFKGEYGTSKVGGYTLEGMLAGRNGELMSKSYADRITALEATVVNNI